MDDNINDKPVADILSGFRWNKPHLVFRKEVIPEVLKRMGCPDAKVSWSQKAGCSCGCSPGFIVKHPGHVPKDVFVNVVETQPELL